MLGLLIGRWRPPLHKDHVVICPAECGEQTNRTTQTPQRPATSEFKANICRRSIISLRRSEYPRSQDPNDERLGLTASLHPHALDTRKNEENFQRMTLKLRSNMHKNSMAMHFPPRRPGEQMVNHQDSKYEIGTESLGMMIQNTT